MKPQIGDLGIKMTFLVTLVKTFESCIQQTSRE